jgi:hypothetical protein
MADTVIENFLTTLGFDFDEKKLKAFDKVTENIFKTLTKVYAAAVAAGTGIFIFTQKIAESNDQINRFAQSLGIDIETLQELGYVAELNKGSIDSMNSALSNLTKLSSEAARGLGAGVEVFGILGLSATNAEGRIKSADDLMLEISDSISKLGTQAEKLEFAEKLGFGRDLLLTLQQGSAAIKKQREEAKALGFVIDKDAAQAAEDFADTLLRVTRIVQGVANAIATRLMKQITPMMKIFKQWFIYNKDLIEQGFTLYIDRVINSIRVLINITQRIVSVVVGLVNAMGGWKNSIIAVTALLVALNATALLMPVLVVAAAAGILLLLEDVQKFAEGGDSALGNLAKRFPDFDAALRTTLDLLGMVRDGWVLIFTQGEEALDGLLMMIKDFPKNLKEFLMIPLEGAIDLINKIPGLGLIPSPTAVSSQQAGGVGGLGGGGYTTSTVNNTTNSPSIQMIFPNGDKETVKQGVREVLDEQYSNAKNNLGSTVEF